MSEYIFPGGYSKVIESYSGVNVSAPDRALVIIGSGKEDYSTIETVVKGVASGTDTVLKAIAEVISVKSQDGIKEYIEDTHFSVSGSSITWIGTNNVEAIMMGSDDIGTVVADTLTLKVETNEGIETITFGATEVDLTTILAEIVVQAPTGFTAAAGSGDYTDRIVLTSVDDGDVAFLKILDGTSNLILHLVENAQENGFGEPVTSDEYVVSYKYAKVDADYVLKSFYNAQTWYDEYGYPLDDAFLSSMGIAGEFIFSQIPNLLVYGIQTKGTTKYDYQEALTKLEAENFNGVPLLIPLTTNEDVFTYLKNHCNAMATYEERKERTGIVGHSGSGFQYDFRDVTLTSESTKDLTGEFLAVLMGVEKAKLSDLARTITFKTLDYIQGDITYSDNSEVSVVGAAIDDKNIELAALCTGNYYELRDVAKSGVSIIEKNSDGTSFVIKHDLSTKGWEGSVSPMPYESEPTSVAIRYYTAKVLRETLIARHGGEKITSALLKSVELTTILVMDNFIVLELITDYDRENINAIQDEITPIKINVIVPEIESIYNNLITDTTADFLI